MKKTEITNYDTWYIFNRETKQVVLVGITNDFEKLFESLFFERNTNTYSEKFYGKYLRPFDMDVFNRVEGQYENLEQDAYQASTLAQLKVKEYEAELHNSVRIKTVRTKSFEVGQAVPRAYVKVDVRKPMPTRYCEFCCKDVANNLYGRFHGDNCLQNPNTNRVPAKTKATCTVCGLTANLTSIRLNHNENCKGGRKEIRSCKYCGFKSTLHGLARNHNENCKQKPKSNE